MLRVRRRGVQHYVIKFVSDLRQFSGFIWVLRFRGVNTIKPSKEPYHMATISQFIPTIETSVNMMVHPYYQSLVFYVVFCLSFCIFFYRLLCNIS